ncbi:signal-regulatory protein beta-2-like [Channa argus]|uniref:signal-regulatory protein beta-2-like n=1 Tax=Channa argus TaxID=215402 RepID=UPI0035211A4C
MRESRRIFLVCLLTFWGKCSASEVQPGEDVLLLCQGPGGADIVFVEWIRPDLVSEGSVFFFRDDLIYKNYQHPSFHGRVELRDPQMRDEDVSVILKKVNIKDTGTYECYVGLKGNSPQLISIVHLKVKDSDQQQITVKTGDDVTLQCLDHRGGDIKQLEWRRQDLEEDVFICRHGSEDFWHPSFKNRVKLRHPQMKDGDVSVIVKNVTISDAGTYECYVRNRNTSTSPQSITTLTVTDSGGDTEDGESKDRGKHGHVGLVVGLSVVVLVVGTLIFKKCNNS